MTDKSYVALLTPVMMGVMMGVMASACREPDETEALLEVLRRSPVPVASAAEVGRKPAINPRVLRRFEPVRVQIEAPGHPLSEAKIALGRALYYEKRLSKDQDLSCNSCHALDQYGVDGAATSTGYRGQVGERNAPTVYTAAGAFAQFWDGRMDTVEQQAIAPILNPKEMALPSAEVGEAVLGSIPEYVMAFQAAFPDEAEPITFENVGKAIAAFERTLTTPSRWDDYLRGDEQALTAAEIEGLKVFTNVGCMVCHTGEFVGGAMYQKVGVVEPWPKQKDQGRFEVTGEEVDRMTFKVPTLRNVAKTAPYFHDGSVNTLELAVRMMGRYQLGLRLSEEEVDSIVAWLDALTGTLPAAEIQGTN